MKKIILILIFIALIFVANLSMTYPALYGVNTVAILVALFGLLFYKRKNQPTKTLKEKLKPSKGVIIFILLVFLSLGYYFFSISTEFSKNNKSMMKLANKIQAMCLDKQECPLSLSPLFDDIKLIKPNSILFLDIDIKVGPEDEIANNATSIKAAGYIVPSDDSKRTYRYKLKSDDSAIAFDYTASSRSFALSYVAYRDLVGYPLVTGITGGVNFNVTQLGVCEEWESVCKAIKEHDF